ncbi:phosphoribosyltransferase [Streptomyces zhihengii]|uniref:phosphoribosyltransferase n=1 Tax=Streptomyces zhihengii TaxID=1818004 RepID=UPI003636A4E4
MPDGLNSVDFLLGLDAGGILPTVSLASAARLPYKIAWKLHLPLDGAVRFSEPHAMRTDVFAYGIAPGQRIVIVDDEITTGRTLTDLTRRLREAGAVPLAAACLVEDTTREARDLLWSRSPRSRARRESGRPGGDPVAPRLPGHPRRGGAHHPARVRP